MNRLCLLWDLEAPPERLDFVYFFNMNNIQTGVEKCQPPFVHDKLSMKTLSVRLRKKGPPALNNIR